MGSFSVWHWLIVVVLIALPLVFILRSPPSGPNRYGHPAEPMNLWQAVGSFFRNYVNFSGRARRSEFWYAYLFNFVVSLLLLAIDRTETLYGVFGLAVLLPTLAMAARRLHDINRSGWHQVLWCLFPIGTIALLIWYCTAANDDDARMERIPGLDPKPRPHATADSVEILERLSKLKDSGAITAEEYEAEKRKILS